MSTANMLYTDQDKADLIEIARGTDLVETRRKLLRRFPGRTSHALSVQLRRIKSGGNTDVTDEMARHVAATSISDKGALKPNIVIPVPGIKADTKFDKWDCIDLADPSNVIAKADEFEALRLSKKYIRRLMTIDPPLAGKMLEHNHAKNRSISERLVDLYGQAQAANQWAFTGQGILFGCDGQMHTGQHRMTATVKYDAIIPLIEVSFGLPVEAFGLIDAGKSWLLDQRRTSRGDSTLGDDINNQGKLTAICRALLILRGGNPYGWGNEKMDQVFLEHEEAVRWVAGLSLSGGYNKAIVRALFAWVYPADPVRIIAFLKNVLGGLGDETSAESFMRKHVHGSKVSSEVERLVFMQQGLRCIYAYLHGRKVTRMALSQEALDYFSKINKEIIESKLAE